MDRVRRARARSEGHVFRARARATRPISCISNNSPELLVTPDEPALPIDPEPIRVITFNQSNDDAGLDAMQPMEMSNGADKDADRFYLLPLPAGLHPESPEMFGFFTYEIRVGHYRYTDTIGRHQPRETPCGRAPQGRFGRVLRVPGIQHPAPTLTCIVNRDEEKLYVTAPYAVAVHNGKNVTADPPRTEIWALLYAQVKQADNKEFRNILLDDLVLSAKVRVEHDKAVSWKPKYTVERHSGSVPCVTSGTIASSPRAVFKLTDPSTVNSDATKYGTHALAQRRRHAPAGAVRPAAELTAQRALRGNSAAYHQHLRACQRPAAARTCATTCERWSAARSFRPKRTSGAGSRSRRWRRNRSGSMNPGR